MSKLFKIPQEKYFLSFFMFTNNHYLCFSLHVDHEIEAKLKISGTKRKFLISFDSELVCGINIIVNLFEELKESEESIFRKIMFHILDETFNVFGFISISIKLITKKLSKLIFVNCGSQLIWGFFARYDEFEFISMTKNDSIKMFDLLFLSNLESINKNFSFWFRNNKKLFSLLKDGTMSLINTQSINFDIILFDFIRTNIGLTLFQFVDQ